MKIKGKVIDLDVLNKSSRIHPKFVVEKLLRRGITFFDNDSLPYAEKKQYYNDARGALRNKTLMNEINHMVADTVEHLAKSSQNFEEVERLRMSINFAALLQERLANIQDPEKDVKIENPDKVQKAYENLI